MRQRSITSPQRSAKRQPVNTWFSGGTVPGIDASLRPRLAVSGSASNRLTAYGMQRTREELLRVGDLDDLAGVHQRDAMRHLRDDREVVRDQQHRHLLRACSSFSRSRICAWIVTSSAVVGSSAIRKSGSAASAIAIITRCFWPPDIWNG